MTGKIEFAHNAVATNALMRDVAVLNEVAELSSREDQSTTTTTEQPQDEVLHIDGKVLTLAAIAIISGIAAVVFFISVLYVTYICLRRCNESASVSPNTDVFYEMPNRNYPY